MNIKKFTLSLCFVLAITVRAGSLPATDNELNSSLEARNIQLSDDELNVLDCFSRRVKLYHPNIPNTLEVLIDLLLVDFVSITLCAIEPIKSVKLAIKLMKAGVKPSSQLFDEINFHVLQTYLGIQLLTSLVESLLEFAKNDPKLCKSKIWESLDMIFFNRFNESSSKILNSISGLGCPVHINTKNLLEFEKYFDEKSFKASVAALSGQEAMIAILCVPELDEEFVKNLKKKIEPSMRKHIEVSESISASLMKVSQQLKFDKKSWGSVLEKKISALIQCDLTDARSMNLLKVFLDVDQYGNNWIASTIGEKAAKSGQIESLVLLLESEWMEDSTAAAIISGALCDLNDNAAENITNTYEKELGFTEMISESYPNVLVFARLLSTRAGRSI